MKNILLFFLLVGVALAEDSLIVEAEPNVEIRTRGTRQIFPHSFSQGDESSLNCTRGGNLSGKCLEFEACFPLRNVIKDKETNALNQELKEMMGKCGGTEVCCPIAPNLHSNPLTRNDGGVVRQGACGNGLVAQTKIVNGTNTIPGELPWMVVMYGKSGKQTCGGSLISENIVLTAAHCINNYGPRDVSKIRIHIGDYNIRSGLDGKHEIRGVKRLIKHKYFNIQSFINDIALLRLDKPVSFTPRIQPICLPSPNSKSNLINRKMLVAGWGRTSFKGQTSPILQKVSVKVWTNADCATVYKGIAPAGILSTMICAGEKGLDSCVGDSGGPLQHKTSSGHYEQVGIVSFGKGCGTHPGVYTRITEFLPWIRNNMHK